MTYIVRGSTSFDEDVFYRTAETWDMVKEYFNQAIEDGCHPNDILVFEASPIDFSVDYTLIVRPR